MCKVGVGTILIVYLSVTISYKLHMNNIKTVVSANSYIIMNAQECQGIHKGVI